MRWVDTANVRSRFVQPYPAADGTLLSADVYLPPTPGRYPVLVTRTPYDNNRMGRRIPGTVTMLPAPADRFKGLAASGCIVVAADVRGRGDSEGEFVPFANEQSDGVATVEWAAALPETDGRLFLFGSGYAGFCALAAATAAPDRVAGVSVISPFGPEGLPDRNGVLRLDWLFWQHLCGGRTLQAVDAAPWTSIWKHLPLRDLDGALGRTDVPWKAWLEGQGLDALGAVRDGQTQLRAPVRITTGWWDPDLRNAVDYYGQARNAQLVVGPWDQRTARRPERLVGGIDWGVGSLMDADEELLRFVEAPGAAGVRAFLTGRNTWVDLPSWPPSGVSTLELRLTSEGAANTRRGDGKLVSEPVDGALADSYIANPENPVSFAPSLEEGHISARDDALCYTGAPASEALVLAGRPRVSLWVQTDAPDTDVVVLLSDVFPYNGRSVNLAHTATRLATVEGFAPGAPTRLELELDDVFHEVQPGHSLRLTVTSGLHPHYARNPNQPDYLDATEPALAELTVLHGTSYPSALSLPSSSSQK